MDKFRHVWANQGKNNTWGWGGACLWALWPSLGLLGLDLCLLGNCTINPLHEGCKKRDKVSKISFVLGFYEYLEYPEGLFRNSFFCCHSNFKSINRQFVKLKLRFSFEEVFHLVLTLFSTVKWKISSNFVVSSEYINFIRFTNLHRGFMAIAWPSLAPNSERTPILDKWISCKLIDLATTPKILIKRICIKMNIFSKYQLFLFV